MRLSAPRVAPLRDEELSPEQAEALEPVRSGKLGVLNIFRTLVHAPKALRFLIDIAGIDNVLLGTDYSFPPADMEPLALLKAAGLSKADTDAIAEGNPRRLFARLK